MSGKSPQHHPRRFSRNHMVAGICLVAVVGMVGMSYAAVPLYRLFCQVTGYGGTPQVAEAAPVEVLDRVIEVRVDANGAGGIPGTFRPEQREIALNVGEQALAFYRAENVSGRDTTGTATFNVTPLEAGAYFNKVDCFCFTEQHLEPGRSVDMPVTFFIDPAIADDPNLDHVRTITLSYTFFPTEERRAEAPRSVQ